MMNRSLKILIFFLFGLVCVSCSPRMERYSEKRTLMATYVTIDVCYEPKNESRLKDAYTAAWDRFEEISWRMNIFDAKSDLSKIHDGHGQPVVVGADTYQVIKNSVRWTEISSGAFDVTVWPLIQMWKEASKRNQMPSPETITAVRKFIGPEQIEFFDNHAIRLKHEESNIDLGGIAKGYAIDEAARIFREHGFEQFYIDAGGDVYVGGLNCRNQLWRIGIRDPRDKVSILDVVEVTNKAIATSGNYERFMEINGERYSHIIDPRTGYPQKDIVSATVIASTAEDADAAATSLCVLGREEGQALIARLGSDYASMMMQNHNDVYASYPDKEYEKFRKNP